VVPGYITVMIFGCKW